MGFKIITPPEAPVLPLDELHAHLRLGLAPGEEHPEDALILRALAAARRLAEQHCNRAIGVQTVELAMDDFPPGAGAIKMPWTPVLSINSVTYVADVGGTYAELALPPSAYAIDDLNVGTWLLCAAGTSWPAVAPVANAVRVRYQAGDLPDEVVQAMLLVVGHYFKHRQAVTDKQVQALLMGVDTLLDAAKVYY